MSIFKQSLAAISGILAVSVLPAGAANVRDCNWAASAHSLAEPWEKNTKVFLNGAVRIALIDTGGEPVCCSTHLLVLAEDKSDEHGGRVCRLVSNSGEMGYEWIDFARITSTYHPSRGLQLTMPFKLYVDGVADRRGVARITINTQNGVITAR